VATELYEDDGIVDAEFVEEGRTQRLRAAVTEKASPHAAKAKAAYGDQKVRVGARVKAWFATADVTDVQLGEQVVNRKRKQVQQADESLIREVARQRSRLTEAKIRAARDGDGSSTEVERINGDLAAAEARLEIRAAEGPALAILPPTSGEVGRARWSKKAGRVAIVIAGGLAWSRGIAAEPIVLLLSAGGAPFGWWYLSRPLEVDAQPGTVSLVKGPAQVAAPMAAASPYGASPSSPAFDAPAPPALDEAVLTKALRDCGAIGRDQTVTILSAPAWGPDGTATIVFDLPSGGSVAKFRTKAEEFAGALGRDSSMIDITKAGTAVRVSLWMSDIDPFADVRPSPLMTHKGGIDAWKDGIPVAWAKRGNAICLPVMNSNFLIAGMTRSGKGVGAANLAAGAAMDVRINLRVVAGKANGEWDSYAKAGVAATYFKPNAARLLALLEALVSDMDRRNKVLGELSKSKLTRESIERVGGLELLVIDELATYTRPGKPLRDEILEALIQLSAVAAGAGILLVLITQYPEVDVIPQALAMNCGTRWAMRVDNATQSNAILGGGSASSGRDASKFDPPLPGLGWMVNPFAGVTDLARSFDLDEDERGEVTMLMERAADLRSQAGRLTGQWDDPIEQALLNVTGLSSAAGGPERNGVPGRAVHQLTPEQRQQIEALRGALAAMDHLDRDEAQLDEMAKVVGGSMTGERLGELLRSGGAGGTVKVTIPGRAGRVNGYQRADIEDALKFLTGA
jgi:DNA segregation ATPase FtsK/SpoIIIE, S-DNA-T family